MIPFERVFRLLDEHDVRYVVVGGIAVILHGTPRLTADLDIIIDLEPAQTVLALASDGLRLQGTMNVSLLIPAQTALGKNVRSRSRPSLQGERHNFLRVAHSVNRRGVYPVNAKRERTMNRRD